MEDALLDLTDFTAFLIEELLTLPFLGAGLTFLVALARFANVFPAADLTDLEAFGLRRVLAARLAVGLLGFLDAKS